MKAIVFSNPSYVGSPARVGLQILAELLAGRGHQVDYVGTPTNPLDFLSPSRRSNFFRAWLMGGDRRPSYVAEGLSEYFFRAPFTRSRAYWRWGRQVDLYGSLMPKWVQRMRYDVCIRDTAMSGLFASRVDAAVHVLRLNDDPGGLVPHIHPMVVSRLEKQIRVGFFREIWATNTRLVEIARELNPEVPAVLVPNGVLLERFAPRNPAARRPKSAVYLGAFNEWFDATLLAGAAELLADWTIDLFGPPSQRLRKLSTTGNVHYHGPVSFEAVPEVLGRYRVGLIPFGPDHPMVNGLDPLKAYQYLAGGLGVAATSHGALGDALGGFARFGNTREAFASAIRQADADCDRLAARSDIRDLLAARSWTSIVRDLDRRLNAALNFQRRL